ncbi:carbon starvation induced protein CsiD [Alkalihalobacillus oceani]|uniref:glutarate dioxygenase GlaH n=1 Tax=Halalkalibacter oceani TaxID=1653776 RepID=UPI00203E9DE1|nr:glutarate dioxygenase GlaH [Halalkalibacter oceani]MCM3762289.1 carbon starvation induced protein CsiD [Halalkalibacter oceani]
MTIQIKGKFNAIPHPVHHRLKHIEIDDNALTQFLENIKHFNVERIEYVPFMRFALAVELRKVLGESFQEMLKEILHDRETGGFTIGVNNLTTNTDDYIKFSTALTHLIGIPNHDAMSNKFYAIFTVKHTFESDTYLRKAYRILELHTDGTFVEENTDWVLMMKMSEKGAVGGESRLLHLDDWDDLGKFSTHPLAAHKFKFSYADRGSKNIKDEVHSPSFFYDQNKVCIKYNHQCTHPQTISEALYLKDIQDSMENSSGTVSVGLPVGQLVIINNKFWLHGREPFVENPNLERRLMRQRGRFIG